MSGAGVLDFRPTTVTLKTDVLPYMGQMVSYMGIQDTARLTRQHAGTRTSKHRGWVMKVNSRTGALFGLSLGALLTAAGLAQGQPTATGTSATFRQPAKH